METKDIQQRTEEWIQIRKGKFTGSEIWKLMVDAKSKTEVLSETAKTYVFDKVAEMYSTQEQPKFTTPAMEWGITNEPLAKRWYQRRSGNKVLDIGYIPLQGYEEYAGGSPDGIVEFRNLIEIKCPYNPANHIKYILTSAEDFKKEWKEYYWQMQFYMSCLDLPHCDFISFDPRVDEDWGIHIKQIQRNDNDIAYMIERIGVAIEFRNAIIKHINESQKKADG